MKEFGEAAARAAAAINRFVEAVDGGIRASQEDLARQFAAQQGSPVASIEWGDGGDDNQLLVITLENRRKLVGMGPGRLDALAEASRVLAAE